MEIILETREMPKNKLWRCVCVYVNVDGKTQVNGLLEEEKKLDVIHIRIIMWKERKVSFQIKALSHHGYFKSAFLFALIG